MTSPLRFLFDECIGLPTMEALRAVVPDPPEFAHLTAKVAHGELDSQWIPKIAAEGGWVVVTADCGKQANRGGKLPWICAEHKVTHVLMTPRLHSQNAKTKLEALVTMWDRLLRVADEPPGTRFKLRYKNSRTGPKLTLERVEPPPPKRK